MDGARNHIALEGLLSPPRVEQEFLFALDGMFIREVAFPCPALPSTPDGGLFWSFGATIRLKISRTLLHQAMSAGRLHLCDRRAQVRSEGSRLRNGKRGAIAKAFSWTSRSVLALAGGWRCHPMPGVTISSCDQIEALSTGMYPASLYGRFHEPPPHRPISGLFS